MVVAVAGVDADVAAVPARERGERVSREELSKLATDGRVGANIRIIGLDDDDKKAREKRRKEEREAKRQAERDRLARLGYDGDLGDAFFRWAGNENLEERVDGVERIDPVVLEELRKQT